MNSDQLAQNITDRLKAGDFEAAHASVKAYGAAVCQAITLAGGEPQRKAVYDHSMELIDDALHLARVLRAHLDSQARSNVGALLYSSGERRPSSWRFDG